MNSPSPHQLQRIQAIDALLPQTQCGKCGHPGCLPYAQGIANGEAINKCPPGGDATVDALASLLNVAPLPLALPAVPAQRVVIREAECIGCTKCIQACPLDAIVGAAKLMHTVIADECSGCELCIAPCPVDCIDILPLQGVAASEQRLRADQFRTRHRARLARLEALQVKRQAEVQARNQRSSEQLAAATTPVAHAPVDSQTLERNRRLKIEAAMARVSLNKTEKQLAAHGTPALQRQVEQLRIAAEKAQQALDEAQRRQPAAPSTGLVTLTQAKIKLASCRAELSKAERQGLDAAALEPLRQALRNAEHALHAAEAASGKPAPEHVLVEKNPIDPALRNLKTEQAYARAALSRLERRTEADPQALAQARQRLAAVEQQLHDLRAQ